MRAPHPKLSEEQRAALGAELDALLYMTAKAVCALVQRTFAVTYTPHAMAKLLKRLGFVYKMPKKAKPGRLSRPLAPEMPASSYAVRTSIPASLQPRQHPPLVVRGLPVRPDPQI